MMMNILSLLLLLATGSNVAAFTVLAPSSARSSSTRLSSTTASPATQADFYKAVQSAAFNDNQKMDLEELDRLASQLEAFEGCAYEEEGKAELCDKEIQDRMDLAQVLRLKIELQLRLDYLENANLFADDVRKEHDLEKRKKFKEELIANREKRDNAGSDLGLW